MEVIEAQHELQYVKFYLPLCESCISLLLQDEGQFPAAHEWHDQIEPFAGLKEEEEADEELMLGVHQDSKLQESRLYRTFFDQSILSNTLDCVFFLRPITQLGKVNIAERTLSELVRNQKLLKPRSRILSRGNEHTFRFSMLI